MRHMTRTLLAALATAAALTSTSLRANDPQVVVANAWARAMPAGTTVGAAYLEITAKTADKLVAIATPRAARAELHTHLVEDGKMSMRRVEALSLNPGEPHTLAPGGDHIMLFDVTEPLRQGDTLPLALTFEKAGLVSIEAKVLGLGAQKP